MKLIGMVTVTVGTALVALAVVVGVRSIPDVKRYLKMRQM
jgi:hypothetical protein